MKALVLIASLLVLTYGRPEAGYSYNSVAPSGSYYVPGSGVGITFTGGQRPGISNGLDSVFDHNLDGGHVGLAGGHGLGSTIPLGSGISGLTTGIGTSTFSLGETIGGIGIDVSGAGISLENSGVNGGSTLVQKHIYVHVPPPEPQENQPQRPIHVPAAQKHYKIIFIKTPTPPVPTVPTVSVQPQNEEKTLVYVLVKKPEDAPEITIPTVVPTPPSKPEVYFIRYKTQKNVVSGGAVSGAGAINVASVGGVSLEGAAVSGAVLGGSFDLSSTGGTSLSIGGGSIDGGLALVGGHGSNGASIQSGDGFIPESLILSSSGSSGFSTSYGPSRKSGPY